MRNTIGDKMTPLMFVKFTVGFASTNIKIYIKYCNITDINAILVVVVEFETSP